ncbi:MAG: hypothetical protein RR630_01435 [Coprobacillus sp.]
MENKYTPKKVTSNIYRFICIICIVLTILRWANVFNSDILVFNETINSHISNFTISLLFYLAIGFIWMLQGVEFKHITLLGIIIILGNILCETVMIFMNTPDIVDAIYGIVGTLVSFFFLLGIKKYGLVNECKNAQ